MAQMFYTATNLTQEQRRALEFMARASNRKLSQMLAELVSREARRLKLMDEPSVEEPMNSVVVDA